MDIAAARFIDNDMYQGKPADSPQPARTAGRPSSVGGYGLVLTDWGRFLPSRTPERPMTRRYFLTVARKAVKCLGINLTTSQYRRPSQRSH